MNYLLLILPVCIIAYTIYLNVTQIKRFKHNKAYIDCYKSVLNNTYESYDEVCAYVQSENESEFNNKGNVLKLYVELSNALQYEDTLKTFSLKDIFYKNDKADKRKIALNIDTFVWLYIIIGKARELSKFDVLHSLSEKLEEVSALEDHLEYQECKAIYNALCENEDGGVSFLSDILEGNYTKYQYDKNLIMLYKRFASATLAYTGEPMEDYFKEDLHNFAATEIGKTYMETLHIYEKYPPALKEDEEETK